MKKLLGSLLATMLFVVPVMTACSSDEKASTDGDGKKVAANVPQEITVNAMSEPPDIDPALATDTTSMWVLDHLFEGLYMNDKEGNPQLAAAKDVQISEDGKTYTFTLQDNAKWSDGEPLTAQDFEFAWKRVLDPATASQYSFYLYYIKGAEEYNKGNGPLENVGIKAVDEKTLQVELNAPLGYFDKLLTHSIYYPVKKSIVEANKNWAAEAAGYPSNGAYKFIEWKHNSEVVIEKNENYWNASEISMEKITWKMVNDATTYYQMYKTGELDLIQTLPTDVIAQEKNNEEFKITPYFGTYMYMFNVEKEPFNNAKIRRAFNLAINRQALTDNITQAGEIPAFAFVPPGVQSDEGDFREVGGAYFEENAEEAKKLLEEGMAEEGWSTLPEVTLMYNTAENHKKIGEAVQQMIKESLGVDIKLANQEWKTYLDTTDQHNFQMARMGWIGSFVDPVVILDYYLGDSPNNRTLWVNEEFDKLMDASKVEQDNAKRIQMLHDAEKILMTDLPFMPIYHYTQTFLTSKKFEGIVYPVNRYPNLRFTKKIAE